MPDYIGNIEVPEIVPSGVFPIIPDYPHGRAHMPEVVIHRFGSANAKIEQRFLLGNGAKRFTARKSFLRESDRIALRDFWESHYGPYGAFNYNAPNDDGNGTTAYICRFANEPLSWEMLSDAVCSLGVTLIEIPNSSPTYALNQTITRFPPQALKDALLSQVQRVIPLIKIQPKQAGDPAIYVSDRRCTVGAQLYQARLLDFDGISQSIGNEADEARFTFGNADRVMRELANDVDLIRAAIEFSLFHVSTGIKLDLWKGEIVDWSLSESRPEFQVTAADGLYELNLPYPTRRISRQCWKDFNDGLGCPFATQSTGMDYTHFPSANPSTCDKSYDAGNGCLAHGMKRYFGGVLAEPQGVRVKDNSTGTWGFGRSSVTSVSLVSESLYDEVVPEIYTDSAMPVNCKIAAGRDESDFYEAMGIVGEGPLGAYAPQGGIDDFGNQVGHKLDGQFNHGYPGPNGLRTYLGTDPAGDTDFFSLDQSGDQTAGDWRRAYSGASTYKDNFAAGLAFTVIRRSDAKGLQLSKPGDHQMQAVVAQGMSGWVWAAPGIRSMQVLTNPIWIAINMLLRARGLRFADASTAEQYFDVDAVIAAASICEQSVTKLVGTGTEKQFKFRGALMEGKPLRDWIQEILMNCLGYYTFAFGKLKLGIRANSSVIEAFTIGNILLGSLTLGPMKPAFNHLTANFADEEFQFANNSLSFFEIDHGKLIGGATSPLQLKSSVNLSGTPSKSQAARIVTSRIREELGGINLGEWKAARQIGFKTTVLALNTEPGMVCSMTHNDMPNGWGEFRVTGWKLNKDFSIDIQGRTTTDSMYDLVAGPKPADVPASPIPTEGPLLPPSAPAQWVLTANLGGDLRLALSVAEGEDYRSGDLTVLADRETDRSGPGTTTLAADLADTDTIMTVADISGLRVGDEVNVKTEVIKITGPGDLGDTPTSTVLQIDRAQRLSTAGAAISGDGVYLLTPITLHLDFPPLYSIEHPTHDLSDSSQYFVHRFRPGRLRILYASLVINGSSGSSEPVERGFAGFGFEPNVNGTLPGLRSSAGAVATIQVAGPLATGDDLALPLDLPNGASIGIIYAAIAKSSAGQTIKGQLQIDDGSGGWTPWGPEFEIPIALDGGASGSGTFASGAQQGNVGGRSFKLNLTQVGSDFPGEDLTVYITF